MAGLGRRTFAAGEVLTAANVMGYLQDQAVMVFDNSSARSSAIGTAVSEGMMSYLKDTNLVYSYDGSAWNAVGVETQVLTVSTATAYTIASADQGTFIQFSAAAGTITVSTATAFTAGQQVQIFNDGTAWAIVPGSGVTLYGRGTAAGTAGFLAESQYDAFSIVCVGSNAYRIIGNVSAV